MKPWHWGLAGLVLGIVLAVAITPRYTMTVLPNGGVILLNTWSGQTWLGGDGGPWIPLVK